MEKELVVKPYEEKRKFPRIIINSPVNIEFKGKKLTAVLHDLSPDGLQMRCDRNTLKAIRPSGKFIKKENAPRLNVSFSIHVRNNKRLIQATGLMYYFVLLPDDKGMEIAIGMQFKSFKGRCSRYIDEFVEDAITPLENRMLGVLNVPRTILEIAEYVGITKHDIDGIMPKLINDREVICIGYGENRKYVRIMPATANLIENLIAVEERLTRLEQKMEGK